jgi:hypothetical protein
MSNIKSLLCEYCTGESVVLDKSKIDDRCFSSCRRRHTYNNESYPPKPQGDKRSEMIESDSITTTNMNAKHLSEIKIVLSNVEGEIDSLIELYKEYGAIKYIDVNTEKLDDELPSVYETRKRLCAPLLIDPLANAALRSEMRFWATLEMLIAPYINGLITHNLTRDLVIKDINEFNEYAKLPLLSNTPIILPFTMWRINCTIELKDIHRYAIRYLMNNSKCFTGREYILKSLREHNIPYDEIKNGLKFKKKRVENNIVIVDNRIRPPGIGFSKLTTKVQYTVNILSVVYSSSGPFYLNSSCNCSVLKYLQKRFKEDYNHEECLELIKFTVSQLNKTELSKHISLIHWASCWETNGIKIYKLELAIQQSPMKQKDDSLINSISYPDAITTELSQSKCIDRVEFIEFVINYPFQSNDIHKYIIYDIEAGENIKAILSNYTIKLPAENIDLTMRPADYSRDRRILRQLWHIWQIYKISNNDKWKNVLTPAHTKP